MSLVKLPDDALMFPNPPAPGESFSSSVPRNPRNTTKEFVRKAVKLGFKALWLHDLRGSHETCLGGCRCTWSRPAAVTIPAVLLRIYAKRTRKADVPAAEAIAALSKGVLAG